MQGVNWKGRTALHCAAIANRPLSVSLLLLHGAKKDVLSKDRVTALEDADLRSHERCKALLETAIESLSTRKCQAIMADDVPLLSSLPWEARFACRSDFDMKYFTEPGQHTCRMAD